MGNRAVIAFQSADLDRVRPDSLGIYLHWNGGPESVEAFLTAAKGLGVRADDYGVARLCQIIGNWFGGTLSLGIGPCRTLDTDNGDNGTYVVDLKNHGWKIAKTFHQDDRPHYVAWQLPRKAARISAEILAEVLEANRPIFQPEKVTS